MIKKVLKPVHFIGVGGIGMSALARYYKAQRWQVSGSDVAGSSITAALQKEGIKVKIGHKKGNIGVRQGGLVIYNRAIPADNSEVVEARRRGLRVIPYAEALGELTDEYPTIAITGSHGKSTTTALAGLMLVAAGLDPTVLVGTNLREFGGKNIRVGRSGRLVIEADDFGGAFWEYSPAISIVTNIDREHLDFYKNLAGVKRGFMRFMAGTLPGGALILNRDDANLFSLRPSIAAIAKKKGLQVVWYSINHGASKTTAAKIKKTIKIPGTHNVSNAMAAYELGKLLKISEKKIFASIGSYAGAWRRMEYRGELLLDSLKVPVFDDYAHHPTEIKATLQGLREKYPNRTIICVFQPHQAKRLQALFREFTSAFAETDVLVLVPFYKVPGRDDSDSKFNSERLAAVIAKKYSHNRTRKKVFYLMQPNEIKSFLKKKLDATMLRSSGAVLVMMGAGNIVTHTKRIVG